MREPAHRRLLISAEEDVGALRRQVAALAAGVGLAVVRPGVAELVATELATNIVRHTARGGYVLFREAGHCLEFLAVDHGPGLPPRALPADLPGFRGAGLGVGLSSVRRLSSTFDLYSDPSGTVVLARIGQDASAAAGRWRWGAVDIPLGGEGESGDAWAVRTGPDRLAALVVDGLGHGPGAAVAARAAVAVFEQRPPDDPATFVGQAHQAMRNTRGGVLGTCTIDAQRQELTYAAVGNISARLIQPNGGSRGIPGRDGTLGTQLASPTTRSTTLRWDSHTTLVLASDGIHSRWDLSSYPRLLSHDPAVIAAVLHRDHQRGNDDATVLVIQEAP